MYQVVGFGRSFSRHSGRRRRSLASSVKGDVVAAVAATNRNEIENHADQGRSDGGYIGIYIPPKSVYLTNFYVVTGCFFLFDPGQIVVDFEIGMTS